MLFDRYAVTMLAICLRFLKKYEAAEDVMLKGFHKFFEKTDLLEYRGQGSEKAFLKKIMINEYLMGLRENKALCFANELPENIIDRQENGLEKLAADDIFRLILRLAAGYRTVLICMCWKNSKSQRNCCNA